MERVELPATLALALILDPASPRERQREHVCEFRLADDLAGDVPDGAPQHRAEAPQGSAGPLELLGMGIPLVPDQRDLADPHVRLAQGYDWGYLEKQFGAVYPFGRIKVPVAALNAARESRPARRINLQENRSTTAATRQTRLLREARNLQQIRSLGVFHRRLLSKPRFSKTRC